ncbi:MAG: acetate--CoA ligase [bacterium]
MSEEKLLAQETTAVLFRDEEVYQPSNEVITGAKIKNLKRVYKAANKKPLKFWEKAASELIWEKKWTKVLDSSDKPFYKWFVGSKCNIVQNALDQHQTTWRKNKLAITWVGDSGEEKKYTYGELNKEVCKLANVYKKLGIKRGDHIAIYLPNIPEAAIAMLASAKIGAVHSVVYAGFSATALRDRIQDCNAKLLITTDAGFRRGKTVELKKIADEALEKDCDKIQKVIVVARNLQPAAMKKGRDLYYHELMKDAKSVCPTVMVNGPDPLFVLYTSGTTAKPKGVVHDHGGYMTGIAKTLSWVFDTKDTDVWWCAADVGWITGHSYIVYAPLILGLTSIMFEGVPDYPQADRMWDIIEKYSVTILYTSPTAIRALMKYGDKWPKMHDLSSLRLLGSVGEPINPKAWRWYYKIIGKENCPIMDTWWQTESGNFMITPLPALPLKAGSATLPFPGIHADVVDKNGKSVKPGMGGFLIITNPWPGMLQTIFKNPERYIKTYFSEIPGGHFVSGDIARKDKDGYIWIQGRSDDVLKIAGHRIGTAEIESALVKHKAVAEAAAIGVPDAVRGEIVKAFVILKHGFSGSENLVNELVKHVRITMGPIVVFKGIDFVDSLPKTRSGKIMRRVLKSKELGLPLGDISTLED